jgi:hypothetical protein
VEDGAGACGRAGSPAEPTVSGSVPAAGGSVRIFRAISSPRDFVDFFLTIKPGILSNIGIWSLLSACVIDDMDVLYPIWRHLSTKKFRYGYIFVPIERKTITRPP